MSLRQVSGGRDEVVLGLVGGGAVPPVPEAPREASGVGFYQKTLSRDKDRIVAQQVSDFTRVSIFTLH
jgi:hypothetical protein